MDVILFREVSTRLMERWISVVIQSFDFNWDLILIKIYKPLTIFSAAATSLIDSVFIEFRGLMKCLNCAHKLIEEKEIFLITSHRCLFLTGQSCRLPWKISLIFQFSGREKRFDLVALRCRLRSFFQRFCYCKEFVCLFVFFFLWAVLEGKSVHECNKIN